MRVLLVDPDSSLLPAVQAVLPSIPHIQLYCAPDATTAVQHAQTLGGIELLLSEAFMTDLDGFQLRDTIRAFSPQLNTIYITQYDLSGYADHLSDSLVLTLPLDKNAVRTAFYKLNVPIETDRYNSATLANRGPDLETGMSFGDYKILRRDGIHAWGTLFAAVQTTLNRPVFLSVLAPEQADDQLLRAAFLADAGAKSRIQHPAILTVYEAGEKDGRVFYTSERLEAQTLDSIRARSQKMTADLIIRTARFIASGLHHLSALKAPHITLAPSHVLLTADGHSRLINIVVADPNEARNASDDIQALGSMLLAVLPQNCPKNLRVLLARTQESHQAPVRSWDEFLNEIQAVEMEWDSVPTSESTPNRPRKKLTLLAMGTLAAALGTAAGIIAVQSKEKRALPEQILIPAGRYIVGAGNYVTLESFSIDKTEITRGQYAEFVAWLEKNPAASRKFDHPKQPKELSHISSTHKKNTPQETENDSKHSGTRGDASLNLPATEISWWDAYAFANWAGRSLPTSEQWEAAARGSKGLIYPWGDEPEQFLANAKSTEANASRVQNSTPAADQRDVGPFGLVGMAGNVSEWTESAGKNEKQIIKGGNFMAPLTPLESSSESAPEKKINTLGFRTVSKKLR
jgi:formylglycine-generating enzyme required for sulfatase activity